MSDLKTRFEQATQDAQKLSRKPADTILLQLYSLYKQATVGDVSGSRPGLVDFVGRSKYDAWSRLKGTTPDEAMQKYVDLVEDLKKRFG